MVQLLWAENREVPFIAACHKEAAGELLALNDEDRPDTTSREEAQRRTDRQQPEAPKGSVQVRLFLGLVSRAPGRARDRFVSNMLTCSSRTALVARRLHEAQAGAETVVPCSCPCHAGDPCSDMACWQARE